MRKHTARFGAPSERRTAAVARKCAFGERVALRGQGATSSSPSGQLASPRAQFDPHFDWLRRNDTLCQECACAAVAAFER